MASVSKREWITPKGEIRSAWEVRWLSRGRHRSKGGFRLKKAADAFARRVEDDAAAGRDPFAESGMKVSALVELFLKAMEDRLRDGRVSGTRMRNLRIACDRSILPRLGKFKLSEVTPDRLEAWYIDLVKRDGLAPATAKARGQELKLIFDYGSRKGLVGSSPVPEFLRDLRGIKSKPVRVMSLAEVRAVLKAADTRGKGAHERTFRLMQCAVHIAAFCGLRQGEILGLKRKHVRLAEGFIEVRHSLDFFRQLKGPKTAAGVRDVPMTPHIAALIRDWLSDHFVANEDDLVFASPSGLPMHGTSVSSVLWHPILKRAGLLRESDNFHFHTLRHFASSWWIHNGMPLIDTSSLLGHSKFDLTLQIYAHAIVGGNRREDAFARMAAGLLAAPEGSLEAAARP